MQKHFTMLWSKDYCNFVTQTGAVGIPLTYIWGGYNSGSDFNHYKVGLDDYIYPITIRNSALYLIARMQVYDNVSVSTFQNLFPLQSKKPFHFCANQILLGNYGTPINLERQVPVSILEKFTYHSAKGVRKPKYIEVGNILNISSFQGVYQMSVESAHDFDTLL